MSNISKRLLAILLSVMMMLSVVPFSMAAEEVNDIIPESESQATLPGDSVYEADDPIWDVLLEMNAMVLRYLGSTDLTDDEIVDVAINMDWDTMESALFDFEELKHRLGELSADRQQALLDTVAADKLGALGGVLDQAMTPSFFASTSLSVLNGQVSVTDSAGTGKLSGGTVTITAKGSLLSKKTNNITITNESANTATLSFDYSASKANSFKIAGATAAASGSYDALLAPGASVAITLVSNSGFSNLTATLTLSNFSLVAASSNSNITFQYDGSLGSVTAGGAAVASGATQQVGLTDGVALVATPKSGVRFLGWVNGETGEVLSQSASYTLKPSQDMAVKAVFVGATSGVHYVVGGVSSSSFSYGLLGLSKGTYYNISSVNYIVEGLTAAIQTASSTSSKYIMPVNDGVVPAGNYTIPAGVTLLIPFDDANTLYTEITQSVQNASNSVDEFVIPSAYRTLTMAEGANLTVNGTVSLSAKHYNLQGSWANGGSPIQSAGFIRMEKNSKITVGNGGKLYTYGYITGSGSVEALDGATVYENFQVMDFRGGTQSTDMENGVFPMSQYYCQNIEVPLTLHHGAAEYSLTTVYMSSSAFSSAVGFIAKSGAMFNLTDGYVVKSYDGATDRLKVDLYGSMAISSINMTVGTSSINSKNYELPLGSNVTIRITQGSSISLKQDLAMLPGSEIVIDEGATCTLESGYNVYFYDADQWGNYVFGGNIVKNTTMLPLTYVPGRTYNRTEADLKDALVKLNGTLYANGYIYTTAGGANLTSDGTGKMVGFKVGSETKTYQLEQGVGYHEIPITPAQLTNADGSVTSTATVTGGDYNYVNGVWVKDCHHEYNGVITTQPTCEGTGVKTYTCVGTGCGDSYTESVAAKGHTPGDAADCTNAQTCTVCGKELASALGHKAVTDEAKAPTCEGTGLTEGSHCSVCNEVLVAQETVPATGHTKGADATCTDAQACTVCGKELAAALGHEYTHTVTDATCTAEGYTTHVCSRCGDTYIDSYVDALGHQEVIDKAVEATCTQTGLTEGKHCSVCGEVLVAQQVVDALGHQEVTDKAVEATCEGTGLTEGVHCATCGQVLKAQEVVSAKGHTLAEGANCTDAGVCKVCGKELEAALGHEYTHTVTEATCTTHGYTTHRCSRCGDTYIDGVVDAFGHTEVIDQAVEATCTETGLTEGSHCATCGEVFTAQEVIDALGHEKVTDKAVEATCTETGLTEGVHCATCGEILKAQEVVDALGHEKVTDKAVEATCENTGLTEGEHCATCGKVFVAQQVIDALGHEEVTDKAVEATCETTGLTEGEHCATCGKVLVAQEVIDALGHEEVIDKAIEATCETAGLTEGKHCSVCGKVLVAQEVVAAKGHNRVTDKAVEATCTQTGLTEGSHCDRCGQVYTAQQVVAAKGHAMQDATCILPSTCAHGCGYTEGAALGHKAVIDEEYPAFCEDTGLTAGSHCSVCGRVLVPQEVIPALGHDLVYYDAKRPTYTGFGWEAYEDCSRCAYTTYQKIEKLETPTIRDYDTFITNLALLEELAVTYAKETPGTDPLALVIKYIRTGVERYNSGSWGIMAGQEDAGFAAFVASIEDQYNSMEEMEELIAVSSLKKLGNFTLPNGEVTDMGHIFGTMDITYHNNFGLGHADVAGWSGDLVDLLEFADYGGVRGELEDMVAEISKNYFRITPPSEVPGFNELDVKGDMDAYFLMKMLEVMEYEQGTLTSLMSGYFIDTLNDIERADFLLEGRFDGASLRSEVRTAVYNAYTGNKLISTLESTRDFASEDLSDLRKACCYAFADYLCRLAGDYVDATENPYLTPFNTQVTTLAPGITQTVKQATSADGKQMVYYIATADITRDDVHLFANYKDNDGSTYGMQTVLAQANAVQNKYGNPDSEHYVENYNVIASTNGSGFNMGTGEPAGLLVMDGVEYHPINHYGFFGILKDGTPVIGTEEEYKTIYQGQVKEAIAGFGTTLVKNGEIVVSEPNYFGNRASRTAAGITKTGKIVLMVLDGRQEPVSCGGSMIEIAQIMLDAGCVHAINLDGGGSSTFVAKQPGDEALSVINKPSDGIQRSVSTSWAIVSTAPSSTAFDHADLKSEYDYMTVGTSQKITAEGISATGNAAVLPDGTTWKVSDERWATISEEGVFTALRNGSVEVSLMLGDEVLGSKTLHIVIPDNLYFQKDNMDAVYGQKVALPVVALYENKPVAIQASDITFSLSNPSAGEVEDLYFIGKEGSGLKNVVVSAWLTANPDATAKINVALYNQGEATFDFDQATGGNRLLAWYRTVSNATTEDRSVYEVVDANESMVTNYTFAIDMTQIPIPEQLSELVYMLPGADVEGASAWTFLLQLAERISVLSKVQPVIQFDPDVEVDYSNLTLVNEYFDLNEVKFDPATNSLTLSLNWIDQTKAIDPTMANPLCIVSGIKLTPKADADWGAKNRLVMENSGEISYEIYLRANALYSFTQKPENQATYGLYPFINPNDASEKGGYFGSVYAGFVDTYTLVNTVKEGWINEDGGFAYYVEGQKLTGIQLLDGYYYDMGADGINVGQTKYTGLWLDEAASVWRYIKLGEVQSGWHMIEGEWYHFNPSTMAASTGTYEFSQDITYELDVTGRLIQGCWAKTLHGLRYYYGPSYYWKGWQTIDGKDYFFEDTCRLENSYQLIIENQEYNWYYFDENGVCDRSKVIPDGFYTDRNGTGYSQNGKGLRGLQTIDGAYYYFNYKGYAQVGEYVGRIFGEDYKAVTGVVEKDGTLYHYVDGRTGVYGLFEIDGDYYAVDWGGVIRTGKRYVSRTYCDMPVGEYEFGPDGKMLNGIVEKDGTLYYYENGRTGTYGLFEVDGDYYYSYWGGVIKTGKQYVSKTYCDLPAGEYVFGEDGKMLQGIVEQDGTLYHYVNGRTGVYGLFEIEGDYYYVYWGGVIKTGKQYVSKTYCDMPAGEYVFGEDGKMLQGIVEQDGQLYYYVDGRTATYGLFQVDGDYYYSYWGGVIKTGKQYVSKTYCDLPAGEYLFGEDGKMLQGFVEQDGQLYYYVNGRTAANGLYEYQGEYYCIGWGGVIKTGKQYVSTSYCDIAAGKNYEFGADGKMLRGMVEIDGVKYYYNNGALGQHGLYKFDDGHYYYVYWGGIIKTGKQYVSTSFCDLPAGKEYLFDEEGKMLNGFITKEDGIYYYDHGRTPNPGLIYVDGYYYYVYWGGKLITNQTFYVSVTNGHTIKLNYTFDELGRVVL